MKKFAKIFVVALVVTLVAALFAISSSAAVIADPNTLTPGSDKVYFIMDADENGDIPGDGSGTTPENPYKPIDHERFDPEADQPQRHLQTAFYQVTELLRETGGTVVVMGPVRFTLEQATGGSYEAGVDTAKFKENTIKFTSVYNGVDYRETNGAKIILDNPTEINVYGQSIWENIDIETVGVSRKICFGYYATLIGEGVNCYPDDEGYAEAADHYLNIAAGHIYEGGLDRQTQMVVKSGTYNIVAAGSWGNSNARKVNDDGSINWTYNMEGNSSTNLTLEGTTTVLGNVVGSTAYKANFSGRANVTINGGTYKCDVTSIGSSGVLNERGQAVLKINGGDFKDAWFIQSAAPSHLNFAPAISILDLSGWKGTDDGLKTLYSHVQEGFTQVKLPDGVNEADLKAPVVETTAPPADTTPIATLTPGANNNTPGNDKKPGAAVGVDEEGGVNIVLIIIIAVAVLVVAAVVVVAVVMIKKMKKQLAVGAQTKEPEAKEDETKE